MIFHWHLDQSILKHPKFDCLHWWLTRRLCHDLEVMITGDYLKTAIAIARLLLQRLWSGFANPLVDLKACIK